MVPDAQVILTVSWILTGISVSIIVLRLFLNFRYSRKCRGDDYLMSMVILFLIYQTTAMTMVLGEGNNYTFSTLAEMEGSPDALEKSEIELKDQELAAQLHLAGCVTWTMALWTFKYCILMWFARLMEKMDMIEKVLIYAIAATIGATLAVCIIVTFMECGPAWKVLIMHPDPGSVCSRSLLPTGIIGGTNIMTNILLQITALLLVLKNYVRRKHYTAYFLMLFLGMLAIACSSTRIAWSIKRSSVFGVVTLANAETFIACIIANAPFLVSGCEKLGDHKQGTSHSQSYQLESGNNTRTPTRAGADSASSSSKSLASTAHMPNLTKSVLEQHERAVRAPKNGILLNPKSPFASDVPYSPHLLRPPIPETPSLSPNLIPPPVPTPLASPSSAGGATRTRSGRSSIASRISLRRLTPRIKILRTTEVQVTSEPRDQYAENLLNVNPIADPRASTFAEPKVVKKSFWKHSADK